MFVFVHVVTMPLHKLSFRNRLGGMSHMSECARVGRDTQTLGMHVRCYCRTVIQGRRPASEGLTKILRS